MLRALVAVVILAAHPHHAPRPVASAAPSRAREAELAERVAKVRAQVAQIEKALPAKTIVKVLHGCGAETGTLTAWVDGSRVVKLEAQTPDRNRTFWFDANGKLLYSKNSGDPAPEYFFEKGVIFRWASAPDAPSPEEVSATAEELVRGALSDDDDVDC